MPPNDRRDVYEVKAEAVEIDLRKSAGAHFNTSVGPRRRVPKLVMMTTALVCALAVGAVLGRRFDSDPAQGPPSWVARMFYLTKSAVSGGAATEACSVGFHMASIYEVANLSVLRYDTTLGLTSGDAGQGPPSLSFGWIRTGLAADPLHTCNNWTSSAPGLYQGLAAHLNAFTGSNAPAFGLQPWEFLGFGDKYNSASCETRHNVWCVQD